MEGPEPRGRKILFFFANTLSGGGGGKCLTTKEALCSRLFELKGLARTHPPRAQVGWKERKRSFIWLTTSTNQDGGRTCVICLFCIRI